MSSETNKLLRFKLVENYVYAMKSFKKNEREVKKICTCVRGKLNLVKKN